MRMKTRSLSPVGSLHPVIFFVVVYVVALLLSIFICSALFHAINGSSRSSAQETPVEKSVPAGSPVMAASTVAYSR